jgi:hypothetical protein
MIYNHQLWVAIVDSSGREIRVAFRIPPPWWKGGCHTIKLEFDLEPKPQRLDRSQYTQIILSSRLDVQIFFKRDWRVMPIPSATFFLVYPTTLTNTHKSHYKGTQSTTKQQWLKCHPVISFCISGCRSAGKEGRSLKRPIWVANSALNRVGWYI